MTLAAPTPAGQTKGRADRLDRIGRLAQTGSIGVKWLVPTLLVALLAVRLPSLVEPAGGDQGLYSYVADRILHGELPYRDAWDQKPPGIHYTYALMRAVWPHESGIAAADLVAAALVALLLIGLGRSLSPHPGAGEVAALLYLLLANPAFTRLGGVRIRAQCETFIALAVTGALVALRRSLPSGRAPATLRAPAAARLWGAAAGVLLGLAAVYKYNAIAYALLAVVALRLWLPRLESGVKSWPRWAGLTVPVALGFAMPLVIVPLAFAVAGAFDDLYQATVVYNLHYSGGTYSSGVAFLRYLFTFPVSYARLDSLWLLGGLGCAALLVAGARTPALLVAPAWVAAACLSLALNGSRNLPQYFVQAAPALALAAGLASVIAWRALRPLSRAVLSVLVIVAVWRIASFGKIVDYTRHDLRYLTGGLSRSQYLSRFGGLEGDKYSALAIADLADYLRTRTTSDDRVLIFGFSGAAYVQASRPSASRFFWSYPVIVGFNSGLPGYGAGGLLEDLRDSQPKFVVLQRWDWDPDGPDSATYFLGEPSLAAWLQSGYEAAGELRNYSIWMRKAASADGRLSGPPTPKARSGASL